MGRALGFGASRAYGDCVHELLRAAAEIWRETGCGRQLRLIGGLAVPARGYLVRQGYRLHEQGGWLRAQATSKPVVDVARNPVVERSVAAGAVHALHLVQRGALADAFREALGRELGEDERNAFARLLSDLERVGL